MKLPTSRLFDWSVLFIVILLLAAFFGREMKKVQGQAEAATIKATLGALRTAFVLDHLMQQVRGRGKSVASGQRNPFLLLEQVPSNYGGEPGAEGHASGSWLFDPVCVCIGYRPVHSQFLENAGASQALWFRVSAPPGPFQVTPMERYVWQGDVVQ